MERGTCFCAYIRRKEALKIRMHLKEKGKQNHDDDKNNETIISGSIFIAKTDDNISFL